MLTNNVVYLLPTEERFSEYYSMCLDVYKFVYRWVGNQEAHGKDKNIKNLKTDSISFASWSQFFNKYQTISNNN